MSRACVLTFGETDILKYEDVKVPELEPGEVLIETKAASINFIDLRLRSGKSPVPYSFPETEAGACRTWRSAGASS